MQGVKSIIHNGNSGTVITVECHLSNSLPNIVVVGFTHRSIDEARERIRGALANSDISLPRKRITLNLAPADIPKEGSSFDLPMLIAILSRAGMIRRSPDSKTIVLGEVGLDGSIRPIRGIIGKILAGKKRGMTEFWIPKDNLSQASLVPDISLRPFDSVRQLYSELNGAEMPNSFKSSPHPPAQRYPGSSSPDICIDDVVGQARAKRALLIAVAGHHHILFSGPPGTGKTLLAQAALSIMPDLSPEELLNATHLHSLASKDFDRIISKRPFRLPHHTASTSSILGGGSRPVPGEISLSHNGILFFDEFPEFSRPVIESLRQPLENKKISVARSKDSVEFPADFLFIATANPCPCGYCGSDRLCTCSTGQLQQYHKKISGPILDRIDLYVEVEAVSHRLLLKPNPGRAQTKKFKSQVSIARQRQLKHRNKLNSELNNQDLNRNIDLARPARQLLNQAAGRMGLSARAYMRSLRVARTIADLENSASIEAEHVSEALQYRKRTPELTSVA